MEPWLHTVITVFCAVLASSGFWVFIMAKLNRKDAHTRMLLGLGHDRIMYLGVSYITRGWITHDEYENLVQYLYEPYTALGGNGSAAKIMAEVQKLPIRAAKSDGGGKK